MGKITVFYDGSCPQCVKDRCSYEKMQSDNDQLVQWLDITGQDDYLRGLGIDPDKALLELHIQDQQGRILSELDAYRVLMSRVPRLRWLGLLLGLPVIRSCTSSLYHWMVVRRLRKQGRLPAKH